MIVNINNLSRCDNRELLKRGLGAISGIDTQCIKGARALKYLDQAFDKACTRDLRYNTKSNIIRDSRTGVLSRPSNPSEWEECSREDALFYLAREVWCNAIRKANLTEGFLN